MDSTKSACNKNDESNDKIELSRNDLLKLLSCLEGKLQGSEIAIAALKSDRLKRLFYPPVLKQSTSTTNRNKKLNRTSLNYATIIPTNKSQRTDKEETNLNDKLETVLNTNLDDEFDDTSPTKPDGANLDDFSRDLDENYDIKNDLFPNDKYNEYRRGLETNAYLALAGDLKYAYDTESNETLITKVYNSRVLRVKQLIQQQHDARKFLEEQLDELSTRYKSVVDELEIEKDKNVRFQRDETVKRLEKCEHDKRELEDELNALRKEFESEKEREKIMVVYLLSERKQLIIRLIEESEKNTELVNLLSSEKNRSAEMEEGLEEESKRSLQMEIDLECLTNKYETDKGQLEERVQGVEKRNEELESECDRLKQKLNELINSNSTNNNNPITTNKNLPDLGEGVRSTIVTFNNAIAASSTVVSSTQQNRQVPNVVQSLQTKPSLAAKPSFDSSTTNGKPTVTIINSQPTRSNSIQSKASNKVSNNSVNNASTASNNKTNTTTTTSTSVASVIQKFSNNTISNSSTQLPQHPPIVKKLSSSGLVANIAQTIVGQQQQTNSTSRGPPPPIPTKPQINSQLLKERTAKILEQQQQQTASKHLIDPDKMRKEVDLIKRINSNLDKLSSTSVTEACSKSAQNFDRNLATSLDTDEKSSLSMNDANLDRNKLDVKSGDRSTIPIRAINVQKKFVRANAMKSEGSK